MHIIRVSLLLLLLAQVQASCPNECSTHGNCHDNSCHCDTGYFGKDCSDYLGNTHKITTIALQIAIGFMYFLLLILSSTAFYFSQRRTSASLVLVTNVRSIIFGIMIIVSITQGFYVAADPWCFYFMPRIANSLLYVTNFPLGIMAFTSILFHWIEVIQTSIRTMKKEQMMQSININYRGKEVTVEDMVERVHFLQQLKIPFTVFLVFLTVAVYALMATARLIPTYSVPLFAIMYGLIGLCWGMLLAGFLMYGRRLIRLMPFELTKKVSQLTRKLTLLSAFILLCFVVLVPTLLIVSPTTKEAALAQYGVVEILICFICFAISFVFIRLKRTFPFIVFGEAHTHTGTQSSTLQRTAIELENSITYNASS